MSHNVNSIDFYAYESKLRSLNPSFKVVTSLFLLLFCVTVNNPLVSAVVIITMALLTVGKGGMKFHRYLSLLAIPLAFMIMASIAIAVGISAQPAGDYFLNLFHFYFYTSKARIFHSLQIMLTALGAVSAMYMMTLSTPACEIICVLRKMHIPKIIIELMNMIYRFVFILMDVQCKMKNSAESRLGFLNFKSSCYSFGYITGNLLFVSLKKANTYYDAMESRCYDGELYFLEEEKKIKITHIILFLLYLAFLLLLM